MTELSFLGFRLLTGSWCHWEVLFHLQYHFGLSGQQECSHTCVFLPLAFNSLCWHFVKITKRCEKFEKFLYLQANEFSLSWFNGCWQETGGSWVRDNRFYYLQDSRYEFYLHIGSLSQLSPLAIRWRWPAGY